MRKMRLKSQNSIEKSPGLQINLKVEVMSNQNGDNEKEAQEGPRGSAQIHARRGWGKGLENS